jgi:hypothetical protein
MVTLVINQLTALTSIWVITNVSLKNTPNVTREFLWTVYIQITVLDDVTPCNLVGNY